MPGKVGMCKGIAFGCAVTQAVGQELQDCGNRHLVRIRRTPDARSEAHAVRHGNLDTIVDADGKGKVGGNLHEVELQELVLTLSAKLNG